MSNLPSRDQDYELWVLLARTRDILLKARQKDLARYNITARKAAILLATQVIGDKAIPAEIARWIHREPHSTSEILSRMEKEGLVRKIKDLGKKNLVRIMLTEKGREAYYHALERESIHKIMSSLNKEQRQQLRSCLQKLWDKALTQLATEQVVLFPPSQ